MPHTGPGSDPGERAVSQGRAASDPALLGPWIDRQVDRGIPIGNNAAPRAVIAPHVDPLRGGRVYGSAYRMVRGHPARRIVILGVGHVGGGPPFAVSDRAIGTPFGPCDADTGFVRALVESLPFDALTGRKRHRREHSILHQALFLRRVLGGWDRRRVVPILCAFPWEPRPADAAATERARRIETFTRRLASMVDAETLVVAGVDLAHVSARVDDAADLESIRGETERKDLELLERVTDGDVAGFRSTMDRDGDARGICGYPALLTLMKILPGSRGIVVDYGQAVDRRADTLVSFAALVLR